MAELVSKTYSEALFEFAIEKDMLKQIGAEFDLVASSLKTYPAFFELLKSPMINFEDKKNAASEVFSSQVSEYMMNFLKIVLDKRRGNELLKIKADFDARVNAYNNVLNASVESVLPLTEAQAAELHQHLETLTGKNVDMKVVINPELIAGMVVKFGDRIIDGSVKYKLENMLEGLTQTII
ncbi:MAG: F-type H+-transporting ATPase subunit delta [Clostridiales bacterium]|jgi:F-type H+-transporting ATPase subunit delta|nr:F-type H+-transporting ATPase subunit delta [Clostridiales bacterium]